MIQFNEHQEKWGDLVFLSRIDHIVFTTVATLLGWYPKGS